MDWGTAINLVLSVAILILGVKRYAQSGVKAFIFIGAGFLMFALSHIAALAGYAADMKTLNSVVRVLGYLLVMIGLLL